MDYLSVIKKAYEMTLKHKFLWIFGILGAGYGGFRGFSPGFGDFSSSSTGIDKAANSFDPALMTNFWSTWGGVIMAMMAGVALIAVVLFVLNVVSQGALVGSVDKLDRNEKADFKIGFGVGWQNFWRILGMAIIYFLMILASAIVLVLPVIVAVAGKVYVFATIWGILLFIACLFFWVLISLIAPFSLRIIVLTKKGVWESIRESLHFFRDNWKEIVVMYLLLFAFGFLFGICLVFAIMLVGAILFLFGFGIYLASHLAALAYGLLIGLCFLLAIIVIMGGYASFYSAALTLTYNTLAKKSA